MYDQEGHNVCLEESTAPRPFHMPLQCTNRLVGTAPGSETIRATLKVLS